MVMKKSKSAKKSKKAVPEWFVDTEWSPITGDPYNAWKTFYKGFHATVYPVGKKFGTNTPGYEYELHNERTGAEYDSITESYMGGKHPDAKTAMTYAINTIKNW